MKTPIIVVLILLFTSAGIGVYLDKAKKEELIVQELPIVASLAQDNYKNLALGKEKAPPGYAIYSNGKEYTWGIPEQGFICDFTTDSYKQAVIDAWEFYDYDNRPPEVWTAIEE